MEMTDKKKLQEGGMCGRWRIPEIGRDRFSLFPPGKGVTAPLLEKVLPLPFPVVVPALAGKRHAVNFFGPFPEEP